MKKEYLLKSVNKGRIWNYLWTIVILILSISVIIIGFKYNFLNQYLGWNALKVTCSENIIGQMTTCTLSSEPSASGIFFHILAGSWGFALWQLLQIPVWILHDHLIK